MKNIKRMKAVVLTMTMALVMIAGNLNAQYDEDKYGIQPWFGSSSLLNKESDNMSPTREDETPLLSLPSSHSSSSDYEGPVGSGIAVLVGLGAAYLVAKKRKE